MNITAAARPNSTGSFTGSVSHRQHHLGLFWAICAAMALIGFFTANGLTTSLALLIPPIIASLVWRRGEPPVLLFGCMFQWLQATAAIFYTNQFGLSLEEAFGSDRLTIATWLSMVAVVVLACGIRLSWIGIDQSQEIRFESDASRINIKRIIPLYVVSLVISTVLGKFAWYVPSVTQPLLAIAALKWAFVFLICYSVLHQQRHYGLLAACIGAEFCVGLLGVFASFKSVFFVLAVAAMASPLAFRGRRLAASIVCFVLLFSLGVVWSAVKMDYRTFLSDETSGPEDTVPIEKRVEKLTDLLDSITWVNITDGIDALVLRVSYVNFFALAVENVPARVPHENGLLWKESAIHVLMPRFLFPDKPALDDSERTRTYTGVNVSGMESGTSIGIGYVGESYVDFGPAWMFVPILVLGMLYGLIYRLFMTRTRYPLIACALGVSSLIFNAYEIETSNVKLLGGVVGVTIVSFLFYKLAGGSLNAALQYSTPFVFSGARPVARSADAPA